MSNLYQYNGKEWEEIAKNGKDAVVDYDFILSKIPKPKDGKTGAKGKDGSPDTPEQIAEKINTLKKAIDFKTIKNFPDFGKGGSGLNKVFTDGTTITGNGLADDPLTVIGGGDGGHVIEDEGTPLTQRANLNFVGSGVAVTDDAGNDATVVTISSSGVIGTANEIAYFDTTSSISSLTTATYPSLTELSYVKGVTSAIQTQINAKAPSTAPTFATSITASYATASTIAIFDGSKNLISADTATYPSLTELSYVKGLSSAIQTQLNAKIDSIADPNANRLFGWDDTDNAYKFITIGTNLSYDHSTHTLSATGGGGGSSTLADVSTASTDATKSTYTMSSGVPLEFKSSDGNTLLYLDETNERVGIGTTSPSDPLTINTTANGQWGSLQYAGTEYIKFDLGNVGYGMFAGSVYAANEGNGFGINAGLPYINGGLNIGTASATLASFDVGGNTTPVLTIPSVGYTTKPGILINMTAAQTASPFEIQDSTTASVFKVSGNGAVSVGTVTPYSYAGTDVGLTVQGSGTYGVLALKAAQPLIKWVGTYNSGDGAELYQDTSGNFNLNANSSVIGFNISASGNSKFGIQYNSSSIFGNLTTPLGKVHIRGNGDTSSTSALYIEDSGANGIFVVRDDGKIGINTTSFSNDLSFGGNAARTLGMERHTTSNTAGNNLTIQSGGATSGATDKNGGDLILAPGVSTGTGISKTIIKAYKRASSTGTSDNTTEDREIYPANVNLTDNTDKDIFEIALPAGSAASGHIDYSIEVTDGTDYQTQEGIIVYSVVNKAGSYTKQAYLTDNTFAASSGTLTIGNLDETTLIVDGTNKVTLRVKFNSSLTPTSMIFRYKIFNGSGQTITIL